MTTPSESVEIAVRKTIRVSASAEQAFRIFTAEFDSWWPRTHHNGKSPMKKAIVEGKVGGRCYTAQEDGTESDWGRVLVWEPPHRIVLAWSRQRRTDDADRSRFTERVDCGAAALCGPGRTHAVNLQEI
jgi:uncharacterized protein YndB with AHSA1/START domain